MATVPLHRPRGSSSSVARCSAAGNLLRPPFLSPALLLLSLVLAGTVSVDRLRRGYAPSRAEPEHRAKERDTGTGQCRENREERERERKSKSERKREEVKE